MMKRTKNRQFNLFGEPLDAPGKKERFGGLMLAKAIMYVNSVENQDTAKFAKIKAEMYAWAIENNNREMFDFLESRFGTVEIADKEVHLYFDTVHSKEEARA